MRQVIYLFALLVVCINAQTLQQIQNAIQTSGRINSASIGPTLSGALNVAIHVSDIPATNITFQLTSTSLTVKCRSLIFNDQVSIALYFFYVGNDLEMALMLQIDGSLQNLYKLVTRNSAVPTFFGDFSANGTWSFGLATSDSSPISLQKGVTIEGDLTITGGSLLKAVRYFNPSINSIETSGSLYIPVFSSNPLDITLTLDYKGVIPLSKHLQINDFQFNVQVPEQISITVHAQSNLVGTDNQPEVINYALTGSFDTSSNTLKLSGTMQGAWSHPLGLKWLDINSAQAQLVLGNPNSQVISMTAQGTVSFASGGPVTIVFSISGSEFNDVLISMQNIPLSKDIQKIYTDLTGKQAASLQQISVTGTGSITIATYNTGSAQEGLTFEVDATVVKGGNVAKAIQAFEGSTDPSTFKYVATLFVPVFGPQAGIDLSLTETGTFSVTKHTICNGYSLVFDVDQDSQFDFSASLQTKVGDGQTLSVTASAQWEVGAEELTFKGQLTSPWIAPFGLSWMNLNTATFQLSLGSQFSISLSGAATLEFAPAQPASAIVSIGGDNLQNVLFALQNIPVDGLTFGLMSLYVMGDANPPSQFNDFVAKGTASIAISTYDAPQGREGFTLEVDVALVDNGSDIYKAASVFSNNPSQYTYDMMLFIPVFTPNTGSLELSFKETGPIKINSALEVESYGLDVQLGNTNSISVNADVQVTLKKQPEPVDFSISAAFVAGQSLSFTGQMTSTWDHPFGVNWMNITSANLNLILSVPVGLQSFSIGGNAEFFWGQSTGTAGIEFTVSNDFTDVTLTATVEDKWTLHEIAKSVAGSGVSDLINDVTQTGDVSLSVSLSTCDCAGAQEGLTVSVQGTVTGQLLDHMKKAAYWWNKDLANSQFAVFMNIPIFSTDPLGISLSFSLTENITLSKHYTFQGCTFSFDLNPLQVSLDTRILAQFNKNPPLEFEVSGSFGVDNGVLLWGAMTGDWESPFGIHGFSFQQVILEFGMNPTMCATTACISDLGLGFDFTMGNTIVTFDGNAAAPDYWDVFLAGSIKKQQDSLSVVNVIDTWNTINPKNPVSTQDIPTDWSVVEAGFYFAPVSGKFGPISYVAGFGITGGIKLLDMDLFLSINCTETNGFSCNFAFNVDISINQFTAMIKKELGILGKNYSSFDIFKVNDVSLDEWSQANVASGTRPRWLIDMTVLNTNHKLDFRVHQYELAKTFHDFFHQWLASLFP
eukprot:TRINITY_DN8162_c0_g1_i1.p1 TRINITY_DN8162_c0_g1~~TRINITY_DN8162_c0_g1_i1.p1  ORF type:complete len:1221 (+),score=341.94 TRINITY_DN8162_c0_g1_i1:146-3808(+)